jgi:hypothetical protein
VLSPVDSDATPLDADVDSDVTWLFVVLSPVDSDATPLEADVDSDVTLLLVVLRPVDTEVDSDVTAAGDTALDRDENADDRDVTLLFVVLSPVDSEATPVDADVDSDVTWVFVVLSPVDSETIPLDVDVDSESIWLTALLIPLEAAVEIVDRQVLMEYSSEEYFPVVLGIYPQPCARASVGVSRVTVPIAPPQRIPEETSRT